MTVKKRPVFKSDRVDKILNKMSTNPSGLTEDDIKVFTEYSDGMFKSFADVVECDICDRLERASILCTSIAMLKAFSMNDEASKFAAKTSEELKRIKKEVKTLMSNARTEWERIGGSDEATVRRMVKSMCEAENKMKGTPIRLTDEDFEKLGLATKDESDKSS